MMKIIKICFVCVFLCLNGCGSKRGVTIHKSYTLKYEYKKKVFILDDSLCNKSDTLTHKKDTINNLNAP